LFSRGKHRGRAFLIVHRQTTHRPLFEAEKAITGVTQACPMSVASRGSRPQADLEAASRGQSGQIPEPSGAWREGTRSAGASGFRTTARCRLEVV